MEDPFKQKVSSSIIELGNKQNEHYLTMKKYSVNKTRLNDKDWLAATFVLRNLFLDDMLDKLSLRQIQEEYLKGFSMQQIRTAMKKTFKEFDDEFLYQVKSKGMSIYNKIYQEISDMLADLSGSVFDPKEKVFVLKNIAEIIEKNTKFSEDWGIKPLKENIMSSDESIDDQELKKLQDLSKGL